MGHWIVPAGLNTDSGSAFVLPDGCHSMSDMGHWIVPAGLNTDSGSAFATFFDFSRFEGSTKRSPMHRDLLLASLSKSTSSVAPFFGGPITKLRTVSPSSSFLRFACGAREV